MNIARENKIKQTIKIELENSTDEHALFIKTFQDWVQQNSGQKIEGKIESINVETQSWNSNFVITVRTVKEDKLQQITYDGTIVDA